MTPIVFHASVKSFSGDYVGEVKLCLTIPDSEKRQALEVYAMTGEDLIVTVLRAKDVKKRA